ncbi:MAG TPA: fibronectin type III domain-containing protein [Thermoanaerobaculia bacterium]|nr:fibronectin type III domain-containing protein [Thermoanaerobaculia bacterium]
MRRKLAIAAALMALLLTAQTANALITATTYPYAGSTGVALEDMSSGTTLLIPASSDDGNSVLAPIGFDLWFDGTRATQFSVNANGLMRLGATVISGTNFTNSLATTTNAPKLAPYWDDLCTGTNGKVHFKVLGSAPSRKLVIEWQNMQITRGAGCAGAGTGTFQAWLSETTGVIEFVYGALPAGAVADGGYTVGLQSGAATNFASVTTTGATVSYVTANNAQATAVAATTAETFTPVVLTAPSGLNFTGTTAIATTLNWTDNSAGELGFAIYRSTDGGTTYSFLTQTAANAVTFSDSGLAPSTNYFYRVYAVSEGALGGPASNNVTTNAAGNISSLAAGGLWSSPATWAGGMIPSGGDNVTIVDGSTVTIDTAALAFTVTVGQGASGILEFAMAGPQTLTVGSNVTVASGGTLRSNLAGTVTTHNLSVGGNLTNNGTLDFSTNTNTAGAIITFTGAANATFSGGGATTDIRQITMNKGTTPASVLEVTTTNFTHQGVTTDIVGGWLVMTNGTLKLSGTFTGSHRVFASPTYIIPVSAGFWLNNPNYTVLGQAGGTTTVNNGLLRVSQGTFNIGVGAADGMGGGAGAVFIIEGGTVNTTGRIDPQNAVSYTQSGGTVNVATVGNTRSNFGSFELFSTTSSFTMSAGAINVINPSTGATKVDFDIRSTTFSLTGGLVTLGATGAPAASTYNDNGGFVPNFTVNPTMTFNINNAAIFFRGTTIINNGAIIATGASARFDFAGTSAMTYGGAGTFGTGVTPFAGVGISANSLALTTLNAPIVCNRVNLFQGGFTNSGQITLGNGGASTTVVQIGSTGLTSPGGSFDVSPIHMQGTGGEIILYAFETAPRTTGVEINPTRTLTSVSVDNPNNLTLAGGDLTVTGTTAGAITLTNGRVITGANTLYFSNTTTGTVVRTNGYVDGTFKKAFGAAASKNFEVGTANGFSPVAVNVTAAAGFPVDFSVKPVQSSAPNIQPVAMALSRYWTLTATGVTADLTFTYLDPADIPGTATEANFVVYRRDAPGPAGYTNLGGTINTAANTAMVTGITMFSDWTLAEPGAMPVQLMSFEIE